MTDIVEKLRNQHANGLVSLKALDDYASYGDAADEIARLREALRRIACTNHSCECVPLFYDSYEEGCVFGIARAALGEDK